MPTPILTPAALEPRDTFGQTVPRLLGSRAAARSVQRQAALQPPDLLGQHGLGNERVHRIEPGRIDRAVRAAQRRQDGRVRVLLEKRDQFVVNVADHVGEDVDIRAQQILRFSRPVA